MSTRPNLKPKDLVLWAVYSNPSDHPGKFVVWRWEIGPQKMQRAIEPEGVFDTLEQARGLIPQGLAHFNWPRPVKEIWF
jgi:hypothetical protein